jgi:hypothetical protein
MEMLYLVAVIMLIITRKYQAAVHNWLYSNHFHHQNRFSSIFSHSMRSAAAQDTNPDPVLAIRTEQIRAAFWTPSAMSGRVALVHFKGPTEDNEPEVRMARGCGQIRAEPDLSSVTKSCLYFHTKISKFLAAPSLLGVSAKRDPPDLLPAG